MLPGRQRFKLLLPAVSLAISSYPAFPIVSKADLLLKPPSSGCGTAGKLYMRMLSAIRHLATAQRRLFFKWYAQTLPFCTLAGLIVAHRKFLRMGKAQ
jgi:hypothetical protein